MTDTKQKITEDEKALERELAERAEYTWIVTLDATKIFKHGEISYRLAGYRSRNHKYPFIIEDVSNGKQYKLSSRETEKHFASSEQAYKEKKVQESLNYPLPEPLSNVKIDIV